MATLSPVQINALCSLLHSFSFGNNQHVDGRNAKLYLSEVITLIPDNLVLPSSNAPVDLAAIAEDIDAFLLANPPTRSAPQTGAVPRGPLGSLRGCIIPANPEKYAANKRHFEENRAELAAKYPNEFIAIKDGIVTAHGDYDKVFLNGGSSAFMVFPSKPEYKYPPVSVYFTAIMALGDTDMIEVPVSIQAGSSDPEEEAAAPIFKCIDVTALID